MPCVRHNHRRFLPHFPPSPLRCEFGPELVAQLPHAMMIVFPKTESESPCGWPSLLSPVIPTAFPRQLIPKPPGEVSRVGRGGYTLKDVLEGQDRWQNGLYDKIRVLPLVHMHPSYSGPFSGKGSLNSRKTFGHAPCSFRSG